MTVPLFYTVIHVRRAGVPAGSPDTHGDPRRGGSPTISPETPTRRPTGDPPGDPRIITDAGVAMSALILFSTKEEHKILWKVNNH